jgi:porin
MWKFVVILALACAGADVFADESSPSQGLLGDPGGVRTRLYQKGIDLQMKYTAEAAYNAQGGDDHLLRNADEFDIGTTLDLEKLLGWPRARFQVTITERGGNNLSEDARLGTLQQVQEIYGRGQIWRWTEFWYDQVLFDGMLDVKLGRLPVGEDFMSFSCLFQNLSFCGALPGNIVTNWYNWPVSQWATRVKVNFAQDWYAQVGVYQINPAYLRHGGGAMNLGIPEGTTGALIPVEVGWTPRQGFAGLPGAYRIGAWYDSANQPDVFLAANHTPLAQNPGMQPLSRNSESGGYLMLQQQVTGEANARGLSLFANFVQADRDTAAIDQLITLGLFYTGPFDARPQDDVGFAVGRTHVNRRVADGQELQGQRAAGSEFPIELYYSVNVARSLTLRPNVQYIHRPGGFGDDEDVVIAGLKASIKF